MVCMFYFARCMNIIFNSLLAQLVKYDIHTARKVKFIRAIFYPILLLSCIISTLKDCIAINMLYLVWHDVSL